MELIETDVLVVGAGAAALTASALLARAGMTAIGFTKYGGNALEWRQAQIASNVSQRCQRPSAKQERKMGLKSDHTKSLETAIRDLKSDWHKWTQFERLVAVSLAILTRSMVPALLIIDQLPYRHTGI
jgi:malic enzyme